MSVQRKCEFRLYPSKRQLEALEQQAEVCRLVYNWALSGRRWFFEEWGLTRSFVDQCRDLTEARPRHPEWQAVHTHALQGAIKRLDLAFQHFFRRLKLGDTPGFPRYKSKDRFSGFGYKEHGNGWRLEPNGKAVKLAGVGRLRIRGCARFDVKYPKTCDVIHRAGKWYLSITFNLDGLPKRACRGETISGLDWGVSTFATIANGDGSHEEIANPRHLRHALKVLRARQRSLARAARGSKRRGKAKARVAAVHEKVRRQRQDFLHKSTAQLVASRRVIAVEKLSPLTMAASGGRGKRGLNREILAASAGAFHSMLRCKAEEAGCAIVEVNPRQHKPTQTDSVSGVVRKKPLSDRWHTLPDGSIISRDLNAARNLLKFAVAHAAASGGEPPPGRLERGNSRLVRACETSFTHHVTPVCEGGGVHGRRNLRVMCYRCHVARNKEQTSQRAKRRKSLSTRLAQ